jgi:hypothetical protein
MVESRNYWPLAEGPLTLPLGFCNAFCVRYVGFEVNKIFNQVKNLLRDVALYRSQNEPWRARPF